jgi:tetratricopeptide (TPR) repeat protein
MMKTTALWTVTLLVTLSSGATAAERAKRSTRAVDLILANRMAASPQTAPAAAGPQWKSRDEYDAFNAMLAEKDNNKKIALAEAFIQKYPTSDFKSGAYVTEMQVYYQIGKSDDAVAAAKKVLAVDADNLPALRFLSFTFPFLYKSDAADAKGKLTQADADAHHGLDLLQKLTKPAGATDAQFEEGIKQFRAVFNGCIGFVALQNKDYPNAITALKSATADNLTDWYGVYWLGLSYLYSTPRDYNNAVWYGARAVDLAKAGKDPNADAWEKFLKQTYVGYHGTDTGLSDIETQAATTPTPPDGFKVEQVKEPAKTGNNMVDAFNTLTFPLKLGGETAQKQWDGVKGQPIGLGGTVVSVDKGTDANVYLVHIAVLDATKSADGYDIELKDSAQPNVKNLRKGDLLTFKGTLDSYVATPNLILTLVGEVTSDLPDQPVAKPKPPVHHPVHRANPNG